MYPFINIFETQIHMTWLGIIIAGIVFLFSLKRYATYYGLDWKSFRLQVPLYLIIIYFFSQYMWYLIEDFVVFPLNWSQLLAYISPEGYTFHLVGILIASAGIALHFFSNQVTDPQKQVRRIDAWFLSAMLACIPLGFFLLLGDNFIWQAVDGGMYITPFHPDSRVVAYGKVMPLGIYLSLFALILFLATKIIRIKKTQLKWYGIVWWIIFLLWLCLLILFQEYPRHLVFWFLWKTRDIKNIILIWAAWWLLRSYRKIYSSFVHLQ